MLEGCQIDIVRGFAPRTLDFQPGKAAVDGLVNGGVIRVGLAGPRRLPVYPGERTFSGQAGMSQRCHNRTRVPTRFGRSVTCF
jgi:hypothetical protein